MSASTQIAIDIHSLPSSCSSPRWEQPRKEPPNRGPHSVSFIGTQPPTTDLGQSLKALSLELQELVSTNSSIQLVSEFLDRYKIHSKTNDLHPLILEWFNASTVVAQVVQHSRIDILELLFNHGLTVDAWAMNMLMRTTNATGDKAMLEMILDRELWDINDILPYNGSPILGCLMRHEQIAQWLLTRGADPKVPSHNRSNTILHAAARQASISIFNQLLDRGANMTSSSGIVATAAAAHSTTHNRIPIISILLDQGADIDEYQGSFLHETPEDYTDLMVWGRKNALHYGVQSGSKDLVQFLLQRGADAGIKTWGLDTKRRWVDMDEWIDICGHPEINDIFAQQLQAQEEQ